MFGVMLCCSLDMLASTAVKAYYFPCPLLLFVEMGPEWGLAVGLEPLCAVLKTCLENLV
jgi:hypothetical protein